MPELPSSQTDYRCRASRNPRSRGASIVAAACAAMALLAGCSSGSGDAGDADSPSDGTGAFPVEIDHEFGSSTIEAEPERVVALGVTDADIVLALGDVPVANAGYTFLEGGLGPWTDDLVEGHEISYIESDSEPNLEQIAELEPDLILGVSAGFDGEVYEQLSQIAPVVARPAGTAAYSVPRETATELVAKSIGREEEGKKLNDEIEELLTSVREEHPEFEGKTGTSILPYDGKYGAFLPGDARGQFLESLGLTLPETIRSQDAGDSFFVEIAPENIGQVDSDLLLVLSDDENFDLTRENPLANNLSVVRDDAVVVATMDERGAITYNSVLSIPYAVEKLVPRLADALT